MADYVPITPGTGANITSDDCGAAGQVQVFKQAVSADGDATLVTATATDGLLVNLGANNDVTVTGSVAVTSVVAGTGATNLGKAEDAAHSSGDVGVMGLAVRQDVLASLAGTTGDYTPLSVNRRGALYVADANENIGSEDIFHRQVVVSPESNIDVQFFRDTPQRLLDVTTANSATATSNVGGALFSSSTNTNGSVQGVSRTTTIYRSGSEIYCLFTAAFSAGIANSYMRIGLFDANNGFFIGYEGTSFGTTTRSNASDVTVPKGSWTTDTLTGAATSLFTRNGVPEAIDLTKLNVYRVRFGWLGSAPAIWEVMAPDGHWVEFTRTAYPNLQATPSIRSADLPMTVDITKTAAAATNLTIQTDCWGAGSTSANGSLADIYAFQTKATLNNGATYTSSVFPLSPAYAQVATSILASHNGEINIYWYSDIAGTDLVRTITIPYTAASGYQFYSAPAFTPYVKYTFTNNSGSNQTDFYFDTKFTRNAISPQVMRVDATVLGGMVATVNKSVIAGETTGGGGGYVNVKVSPSGAIAASASQDGTWNITNVSGTVSLPTGASTLSEQQTQTTKLTDIETNTDSGAVVGNGVAATAQRVTLASDSTGIVALTTSTASIGKLAANSGVDIGDVDVTSIAAGTNKIGDVDIAPRTTGGWSVGNFTSGDTYTALTATAQVIKGSAGKFGGYYIYNPNTAATYVCVYNIAAASVTVGTSTARLVFCIPAQSAANLELIAGIPFDTALSIAATTTGGGNTAPATALEAMIWYV